MADDTTTTDPNAEAEAGGTTTPPETEAEPGAADVKAMQAALKKANKEAETARLKLREREDADLSEVQRLTKSAAEAEARAVRAEQEHLRLKVAAAAGIPAEHAHRITGDTEAEMAEDAKTLAKIVKPTTTVAVPTGARGGDTAAGSDMNTFLRSAAGRA